MTTSETAGDALDQMRAALTPKRVVEELDSIEGVLRRVLDPDNGEDPYNGVVVELADEGLERARRTYYELVRIPELRAYWLEQEAEQDAEEVAWLRGRRAELLAAGETKKAASVQEEIAKHVAAHPELALDPGMTPVS